MTSAKHSVEEALARLGRDAGEVARSLLALRCTGRKSHARLCPVAKYLRRSGHPVRVVGINGVRIGAKAEGRDVPLPQCVREFVLGFDRGDWPELVSEEG